MKMGLSIIIPAYNEEANVAKCIKDVSSVLKKTDWDWEIIVVNDGSKDKTGAVARAEITKLKIKHARVLDNNPNIGYGGSLKRGFFDAKKEFIAFVPSDNQFDFSRIHDLVAKQQATGADIVSGIRPHGGHDPINRLFFRWGWNSLVRALFGYLATDVDCGFKLFRKSLLDRVSLPSNGAMIDTQLFAGARARGMTIAEIEVTHLPRTAGTSTGGNPKVIFKALRELAIFWWQLKHEILVERGLAVFRWEAMTLASILLLGSFLRLYRIGEYMTFLGDEGRDAIVMRDIMQGVHFPAIGPGTSIGSMYLGPLYYYLTAPSLALTGFSPVGPAIFVAILGVVTVALLWWIGRQWFGRSAALVVSLFYAVSPTVITYSRSSWNPNIMPFFALLTMYGIWKVWRYGYWRWLLFSALSFAFVLNSHYLGLLLLPAMGLFWFASVLSQPTRRPYAQKSTLLATLLFLLLMSPLAIFDARHNFQNFSAVKTFFTKRQETVNLKAYKALPNLWPIWTDLNSSLLAAKQSSVGSKLALFLLVTTAITLAVRRSKDLGFTLVWLGTGLVGLGLYKQHIYDHYYGFLFPVPFLLLGFSLRYLLDFKILKFVAILLIIILSVTTIQHHSLQYEPNNQLNRTQLVADFITQDSHTAPFNLALLAKTNYDAGYRYFLTPDKAKHFTIHDHLADTLYVICELPQADCLPINNPLWEIAAFGWAKIESTRDFPWGVRVFKLVRNPTGQ